MPTEKFSREDVESELGDLISKAQMIGLQINWFSIRRLVESDSQCNSICKEINRQLGIQIINNGKIIFH